MRPGRPLPAAFFARPCLAVAPALVGAFLVRRLPDGSRLAGRIVEVEAYLGDGRDPASHSHRGPTPRNRSMFGPPGRLYVYRSYGVHWCANVVCEPEGRGAAVLLRALEPVEGAERMRRLRGLAAHAPPAAVAGGPGRLTRALGLGPDDDGRALRAGALWLAAPAAGRPRSRVARSPRIGISRAAELPFRFFDPESSCVSRPERSGRGRPARRPTGSP